MWNQIQDVLATAFQQQHAVLRVGGQAIDQKAPCRARARDYVVVLALEGRDVCIAHAVIISGRSPVGKRVSAAARMGGLSGRT